MRIVSTFVLFAADISSLGSAGVSIITELPVRAQVIRNALFENPDTNRFTSQNLPENTLLIFDTMSLLAISADLPKKKRRTRRRFNDYISLREIRTK